MTNCRTTFNGRSVVYPLSSRCPGLKREELDDEGKWLVGSILIPQ